ncbi:hypothetical protein DPEC_G00213050 [Dallia pectoralis]|uniref:Uncharacterized protein n=1 Tax=Dallia pectoralis TaxID=75939 RepID=A0ACC2G6D1_DALPE|nr:hypothetical protein DPEC_G00213050 [Dallia pectoralis]
MEKLYEAQLHPNMTCLKNLDNLLRCPICFEFLSIPMMTKCSHNFCSLCIRRSLSNKLLCPVCNSITTEQDLRNNRILEDLITQFQIARQQMSKAHFDSPPISPKTPTSTIKCKTPRIPAGSKEGSILYHFAQTGSRSSSTAFTTEAVPAERPTPLGKRQSCTLLHSQTVKKGSRHALNMHSNLQASVKEEPVDLDISTGLVSLANSPSTSQDVKPVVKVECPVCSVGISQQFINKHLDNCLSRGEKNGSLRSSQGSKRKPMGKLVYTLLSMKELKRRLKECHLSVQGNRDQLVKRHQDFVHIYNAQCDALKPLSAEDIAKEVEANEKVKNQLQGTTKRDLVFYKNQSAAEIDELHSTYIKQNKSEFSQLIAQVRDRLETAKKIKHEMVDSRGEEGQGVFSSSTEAAVHEQSNPIPSEPGAYQLLMSTPGTELAKEQEKVYHEDVIARSPSPEISTSPCSISSSISDVFADGCSV